LTFENVKKLTEQKTFFPLTNSTPDFFSKRMYVPMLNFAIVQHG